MEKILKRMVMPIVLIILSWASIAPFFSDGFFPMHDDTQPSRVYEMARALSGGQFPVRWVGDLGYGYGYPIFNFYAPLPYYIGAATNLIGVTAISSTKLMFIIGILLAGFGMYALVKELAGSIAGLTSAILYLYAPYHAVNIYVRGAVGELYAYGFLPLLLLGIVTIIKANAPLNKNKFNQGLFIGSISYCGILLSHNILGLITTYLLITGVAVYSLIVLAKKQNKLVSYYLISVVLVGFGLSSFFILPAVLEKKYTNADSLTSGGSNFRNHFLYIDQLWNSPWGFGGSAPGRNDGMSFKIGKIHLITGLFSVLILLYLYKYHRKKNILSGICPSYSGLQAAGAAKQISTEKFGRKFFQCRGVYTETNRSFFSIYIVFLSIFLLSIYFQLDYSQWLWEKIPGFEFIQFPWRLLNFTLFSLSVLASTLFLSQRKLIQIILCISIISLILWFNLKYFVPQWYLTATDQDYISQRILNYKMSQISDEYLPRDFFTRRSPDTIAFHGLLDSPYIAVNKVVEEAPTKKRYEVYVKEQASIISRIAFFPGWKGYIDGHTVPIASNLGRISIDIPSGRHRVEFQLTNTPIRVLANTISFFSLFLLVYVSLFWKGTLPWQKNMKWK